jgi:single-stranded DNA-binding protein
MKGISCAFIGTLTRDAELKTVRASGREFLSMSVTTGEGDKAQHLSVLAWRDTFTEMAPDLRRGMAVLVKGKLELRRWDGQNGPQAGLSVSAEVIETLEPGDVRPKARKPKAGGRAKADPQRPLQTMAPAFDDRIDDLF